MRKDFMRTVWQAISNKSNRHILALKYVPEVLSFHPSVSSVLRRATQRNCPYNLRTKGNTDSRVA